MKSSSSSTGTAILTAGAALVCTVSLLRNALYVLEKSRRVRTEANSPPLLAQRGEDDGGGGAEETSKKKRKRVVLITGGCGFLGREIVRLLLETKREEVVVRVMDVAVPSQPERRDPRVTYIKASLEQLDAVLAKEPVDSIMHVAALLGPLGVTRDDLVRVNVEGTKKVINACAKHKVKRLIITSSVAAVLDASRGKKAPQTGTEASVPYPASERDFIEPYGWTKYVVEKMVQDFQRASAAASSTAPSPLISILRPSIIFGARDGKLVERLLQGLDNHIVGEGENVIDFVHVEDVAKAHVLCEAEMVRNPSRFSPVVATPPDGNVFFVGSGRPTKLKDFISEWGHGPAQPVPLGVIRVFERINYVFWTLFKFAPLGVWLYKESIETITTPFYFPTDKANAIFGYQPLDPIVAKKMLIERRKLELSAAARR